MSPKQLLKAAADGKCVIGHHHLGCGNRHQPAAFVASMQFRYVMQHIDKLKIYKSKSRKIKLNETVF